MMKRFSMPILIICILVFNFAGCASKDSASNNPKVEESFFNSGSEDSNYVELKKVKDNIWVHTTYKNYNGARTPSNGVIAVASKGLILIDTPWNNAQTKELMGLAKEVFKKDITLALITHAHEDRIGGIDALLEEKIDIRSTVMTMKEAEKQGFKKPRTELEPSEKIDWEDMKLEVFYPGEGHTVDNVTVWFPEDKILFGGCLIKSLESDSIGNIEDANVKQWPVSANKVLEKYPDSEVVIPGHGKWGRVELIRHTLDLLEK